LRHLAAAAPAGRHWGVDRERAETHLRLLAEAELRRVMTMPAGSIAGRWHPARLALAAQALTAVGAVGADTAGQIQADVSLAVAARRRTVARGPRPGRLQPARRTSWRVVPVGQVIQVRDGGVRRDVPVLAYVQSAGGARFITADWLFGPLTVTAADDQGVSYQVSWAGEMAPRELLLRPDPRHQIRWLDLTADPGQPATRIVLDPPSPAPAPGITATRNPRSPGELLLDVIAARILTAAAPLARGTPGPPAAPDGLRAFVGDGPGHIVTALHAAGLLPPDSPAPGQLARLCARLGIDGHGITAPPAAALPGHWHDMLSRREPPLPAAPGILAATVTELPGLDGATIAIAGLHHGERGTIMALLATGVTLEDDWPYARGARPLPVLWIRDSHGHWHATGLDGLSPWAGNGSDPWTDTRMVTLWLKIIPPLDHGTAWIQIHAAGQSAHVRATLLLSSP
jgi:hypothetical protein